ncbi:MAG TPA: hypothetical protein VKM37_00225 [Balneolaceae bacterium]|nr:hypothetical protein [Balneolaceae bacterium]
MKSKKTERRWYIARTSLMLLLLSLSLSCHNENRKTLKGYGDFLFGMSEMEVRNKINVTSEKTGSIFDYGPLQILDAAGEIDIGGMKFRRRLYFKKNRLILIQLINKETESKVGCDFRFDRAFGLIKAKYGNPDMDIKKKDFDITKVSVIKFTFGDSAIITLGGTWVSKSMNDVVDECELRITYEAPKGGKVF